MNRRRHLRIGLATVTLAALVPLASASGEDKDSTARLKAMRAIASEAVVQAGSGAARVMVEKVEDPAYRYDDPTRGTDDGTVWVWGRKGEPLALLTLSVLKERAGVKNCLCEWTSLSTARISATGIGPQGWSSKAADIAPRPFPKAPNPAETAATRTRQMGELAQPFKAFEVFKTIGAADGRYELRLLPKPIHRYSDPADGVIDGAIFLFASGTNPEIALLIEARRDGPAPPAWTYRMARIAGAELHATLGGADVWTQPGLDATAPRDPYFITLRPFPLPE